MKLIGCDEITVVAHDKPARSKVSHFFSSLC
jgi:hypothetical protein